MKGKSFVYKAFYMLGSAVASSIAILATTAIVLFTAKAILVLWNWLF